MPFTTLDDLYRNTKMRIALVADSSWERDFKDTLNPTWQKIYSERIQPHLEEYSAHSSNAAWGDMNYFLMNDYDTALYSALYVSR